MNEQITGALFKRMVLHGAAVITAQKQAINDLNVFPVPDGDTGTNMSMTITAAGLVPEEEAGEQLDLFTPQAAVRRGKQEKLERTMDALRDRYGPHVIGYASRQTQTAREIAGDETGKRKEESP